MSRKLLIQLARFATSGAVNTAIGLAAIYAAMSLGIKYVAANAVGYAIGLTISFILNRQWTFEQDKAEAHKDIVPFLIVTAVAYSANLAVVIGLVELFNVLPAIAQLFGVGIYAVISFLGMKNFAFKSAGRPNS